jgi:hypothetical protein
MRQEHPEVKKFELEMQALAFKTIYGEIHSP